MTWLSLESFSVPAESTERKVGLGAVWIRDNGIDSGRELCTADLGQLIESSTAVKLQTYQLRSMCHVVPVPLTLANSGW